MPNLSSEAPNTKKIALLLRVIALAALINFMLTPQLWLSARYFPLSPVFDFIPAISQPYDQIIFYILILLLVLIIAFPLFLFFQIFALLIMLFLAAQDQSRWHPWFYWYTLLLIHCGLIVYRHSCSKLNSSLFNSMQLIICCSYFWGAIQKINVVFFASVFPWFISSILPGQEHSFWPKLLGLTVPICECAIALGLLMKEWRKAALYCLCFLHLFILVCLGPLGHNINSNIWPWNIAMIAISCLLFGQDKFSTPSQILVPKSAVHFLVLIFLGAAPLLSFFNSWDSYPSFALYSGTQKSATLQISQATQSILPIEIQKIIDSDGILKISSWSMLVLNTPDYAESRIYKRALEFLCKESADPTIKLTIYSKPDRLSGKREIEESLTCLQN